MAVTCSKCGEELMGAVNRCWRCGTEFVSRPGQSNVPPVRTAPLPMTAVRMNEQAAPEDSSGGAAQAADNEAAADASSGPAAAESGGFDPAAAQARDSAAAAESSPEAAAAPQADVIAALSDAEPPGVSSAVAAAAGSSAGNDPGVRRGSPFTGATPVAGTSPDLAAAQAAAAARRAGVVTPVELPTYPRQAAATGAALASLVLGILSVGGALFLIFGSVFNPVGTLVTSLLGMAMGIWGVYSPRRGVAIVGLVLCCAALAIAGFYGVVDLYEVIYDENPFAPPLEDIDIPDDFE